jgi:peptide-methionine (S)-S-oxide reductase
MKLDQGGTMQTPKFRKILSRVAVVAIAAATSLTLIVGCNSVNATGSTAGTPSVPKAVVDDSLATIKGQENLVLAGGCFWGIQAVFKHVKGVTSSTSGYSGGAANTAEYETVSGGDTGHAESVKVVYDPSQITYGQLLRIFFAVHNPTELNRQGPDTGTQYRSVIFYENPDQQKIADAYIKQLDAAKVFSGPIVTQVGPFKAFYTAEAYHQDYAAKHPNDPYIMICDLPKLSTLKKDFPDFYRE